MQCVFHNSEQAAGSCVMCGRGICSRCLVIIQSRVMCHNCCEQLVAHRLDLKTVESDIRLKDPASAAALSLLHAGLGQLYNGEIKKGLFYIVAKVTVLLLSLVLFGIGAWPVAIVIGMPTLGVLWGYGIWDAYMSAARFNQLAAQTQGGVEINGWSEHR